MKLLKTLTAMNRMVEEPGMDLSQARTLGGKEVKENTVVTSSHWHRGLANLALSSNKDPPLFVLRTRSLIITAAAIGVIRVVTE